MTEAELASPAPGKTTVLQYDSTVASQSLLAEYRRNFSAYAANLLRIKENTRVSPFILNKVQLEVNKLLDYHIKRHRCILLILKARQTGISTWSQGRLFHLSHLWPNMSNAVIAHDIDGTKNIYNISRLFYENLPQAWKPMSRYSSSTNLVFENPHKHSRDTNPGLRSRISVFTAGSSSSPRSYNFTCLHISEFMFIKNGEDLMAAVIPALPNRPGRFMILESTGNGTDNFGYEYWKLFKKTHDKLKEDSEFVPVFIAWYHMPQYATPFSSDQARRAFESSLDKEEKQLIKHFNLTLEQLHWRRNQIIAMGDNVDLFMQEYPSTPDEAFLSTGRPIFRQSDIRLARMGLSPPKFTGEIDYHGRLSENSQGRLKLWAYPTPSHQYILGVDPIGDGSASSPVRDSKADKAVIQIIERKTLTQVGEWVGRVEPITMAPYVRELGRMFSGTDPSGRSLGEALVVPETNVGMSLVYELSKDYYNIYRREVFDTPLGRMTNQLGWRTDARTKPMLVDFATFCFHNHYCKINSEDLLNEMQTFTYDGNAGSASSGAHDDRVIAWMLALFAGRRDSEPYHPHLFVDPGVDRNRVRTVEQKLSDRIDAATIDVDEWRERLGIPAPLSHWMEY